jgi:brefeldin A-inhibited guanine nucleotide-exchange protein
MTPTILKNKTLALELILSIMDNPGQTFTSRKEFKDIIKDHLCDSILKNSVSTDRPVFAYSLGIFVSLVNHFRENLKSEIAVFVDNVFLKMLESGNSSYHHRLLALQVFYKITSKPRTVLEFYVNYDCDVKATNITEKIIEILCKIAQGKYLRSEYSTVINPQQEPTLKVLALESLVNLVKSLVLFQEEYKAKQISHDKADEKEEGEGSFDNEDPKETTMFEKADE